MHARLGRVLPVPSNDIPLRCAALTVSLCLHTVHRRVAYTVRQTVVRAVDGVRLQGSLGRHVLLRDPALRGQPEPVQRLHPHGHLLGRPAEGGEVLGSGE